jgi:hypothetical protein
VHGTGGRGHGLDAAKRIERTEGTGIRGTGRCIPGTGRHQNGCVGESLSQSLKPLGKRHERRVRRLGPVEYITRDENRGRCDLEDFLDRLVKRTSDVDFSDVSALLHMSKRTITEVKIR